MERQEQRVAPFDLLELRLRFVAAEAPKHTLISLFTPLLQIIFLLHFFLLLFTNRASSCLHDTTALNMTVICDPSPRKRALRSTTTETGDQVGLENKPPTLPKGNNIIAGGAEGRRMVLQPIDDATRFEKNAGAKDEAERSVEEGKIRGTRTGQGIQSATEFFEDVEYFNSEHMNGGLLLTCL